MANTITDSNPMAAGTAAAWSTLVPGLGQWLQGRRLRAVLFALPATLGLVSAIVVVIRVRSEGVASLVRLLVRPTWLWVVVGLNALLVVERIAAVVDAWRGGRRGERLRWWIAPLLVLGALSLVPHAVVHVYGMEAIALLDEVFDADPPPPVADRERELMEGGVAIEDLGPVVTEPTATTTSTVPPAPGAPPPPIVYPEIVDAPIGVAPALGESITVLLAGGDFGPGRRDLRTDVMIVAHLDLVAEKVSLIGISRELSDVPLPAAWARYRTMIQVQEWHESQAWEREVAEAEAQGREPPPPPGPVEPCDCFFDRINYLHVLTADWVRTFPDAPDPGMEALRQTLSGLLGLDIDAYVLVDFAGFVDLVDVLGGVRVTVTEAMDVGFSPAKEGEDPVRISVDPGVHLLDGRQALAYVRDRTDRPDDERMRRQRCMIRELAAAADPETLFFRFPALARAVRDHTVTTLPLAALPEIIDVLGRLEAGDIATLAIGASGWSRGTNYRGLPVVDAPRVRTAVAELIAGVAAGETVGSAEDECAPITSP